MAIDDQIRVESGIARCGELWTSHRAGLPFGDWELRCAQARIYCVDPFFLIDEESGAILPCGRSGNATFFYGGERFSEQNQILGERRTAGRLIRHAIESNARTMLLAWDEDPLDIVSGDLVKFDVPYNQYWTVAAGGGLEAHLASLDASTVTELRYILRKFAFKTRQYEKWTEARARLDAFVPLTSRNFARRARAFALDDDRIRAVAYVTCEHAFRRGALKFVEVEYRGKAAGLCVIVDDPAAQEAVYLINLCDNSPSKISNAVAFAPVVYAKANGRDVNGLRGAFTLKRKYGYAPVPAYAFVKDSGWKIRLDTDLSETEQHALYGRSFGCFSSLS